MDSNNRPADYDPLTSQSARNQADFFFAVSKISAIAFERMTAS
jgi:hypothetical protein